MIRRRDNINSCNHLFYISWSGKDDESKDFLPRTGPQLMSSGRCLGLPRLSYPHSFAEDTMLEIGKVARVLAASNGLHVGLHVD